MGSATGWTTGHAGRGARRLLAVVATALLALSTFAAVGVAGHSDEAFERHWDQEDGHGAENQPEGEECVAWHFVLTPGGERIDDASDLHVEYESGETETIEGQQRGQGAWHFTWEKEDADRVDTAHVHFDTRSGEEGNHILTLSEAECAQVEPDPREVDDVDLQPEASVNPHGSQHEVTATVTDTDGEPFDGAQVRFEVYRDGGDQPVETGVETTDGDGQATFTYTGPDDDADDLIFACTNPDGTAPATCSDDGETLRGDVVGDTAEKQWRAPALEVDDVDLQPEASVNPHGSQHEVTATVTHEGEPVEGAQVRFEVYRDGGDQPVESDVETTDGDGQATFTYTGPDDDADDLIFACTNPDGTAPATCSEDGENLVDGVVGDTATKGWEEPVTIAECRQQTVNLFDETLVLFQANEGLEPCVTDDGSLLNMDQIKLVRSETDGDDRSATGDVLFLGGPDDPGQISVIGTRASCGEEDEQDAWLLRITSEGEELLRISSEDHGGPLPNLLQLDDGNGIFFTRKDEEENIAQVVAIRFDGDNVIVLSQAEARC